MLVDAGIAKDPARWLAKVEVDTLAALDELGEATAADLTERVAGLREQIHFGAGKKWAGKVGVSTRLLFLLATEGRIIRGRPKGTWLSSRSPRPGWRSCPRSTRRRWPGTSASSISPTTHR
jgi:hypothetical protein